MPPQADVAYELGKFAGDTAGFPRVGIVNKDLQLIKDTADFLETAEAARVKIELLFRDFSKAEAAKRSAEGFLGRSIKLTPCSTMFGEYAFRASFVSSKTYKIWLERMNGFVSAQQSSVLDSAFLAGLADAEASINDRTNRVEYSFGKVNADFADKVFSKTKALFGDDARKRILTNEVKIEIRLASFKRLVAPRMRHQQKLLKLDGGIAPCDLKYLQLLKEFRGATARVLAQKLGYDVDSVRRVLRSLERRKLVSKRGDGKFRSPYQYFLF